VEHKSINKNMENENIIGGCEGKGCQYKTAENDD